MPTHTRKSKKTTAKAPKVLTPLNKRHPKSRQRSKRKMATANAMQYSSHT
ncbi:hypothetical protein BVRB_6g129920 [Beta vulgaris subsp. vulgaris]|nr:hypothetical protein BVRB_6g129920 [Beta vulgaris subsp. vulgaris]